MSPPATPANERGLTLLLEECFAAGDGRFLDTLRQIHAPKYLAAFADRWNKDPRPWAREQILAYLEGPLNCPGHQPVVKRLFKQAEESKDDEVMAAFLAAFDRLVRRVRKIRRTWDARAREVVTEEYLFTPRDAISLEDTRRGINPMTGKAIEFSIHPPANARLFSYRTRYYLRRRAWRYFRRTGFQRPADYPVAVARALVRYQDADLAQGENILDSWGLARICFGQHEALQFRSGRLVLKDQHSLAELAPAPAFLEVWQSPPAAELLFGLVWRAKARLVRVWARQLLAREHRDYQVALDNLYPLLEHEDAEVQQFGVQILEGLAGLETLPLTTWQRLLQARNPEALARICEILEKRVAAERFNLALCLELACAEAIPVARLGWKLLKGRALAAPAERESLAAIAQAKCPAVAGELTGWALSLVGAPEHYRMEAVLPFFDSPLREIRDRAWTWLLADSPGYHDAPLWSRLTETPYDDVRLRLVDQLERRATVRDVDQLGPLWCSVLLGVHRGGRQKAKAVRQAGEALQNNPAQAPTLLPVLAVAVRSARPPEFRAGLAAVVRVVEQRPELAAAIQSLLPELNVGAAAITPAS